MGSLPVLRRTQRDASRVISPWRRLTRRSAAPTQTCTSGRLRPNISGKSASGATDMPPLAPSTKSVPGRAAGAVRLRLPMSWGRTLTLLAMV